MAGVDTKTRYQGIFARHREGCVAEEDRKRCNCTPSYFGTTWDCSVNRTRKTRHFRLISEARPAREDLQSRLRQGTHRVTRAITLRDARSQFVKAAREGIALNKRRRRYRRRAYENLEQSLKHLPESMLRRRADRITQGEVQALVDALQVRLSASRISNVVNSLRALYRWAKAHDFATNDPTQELVLPINDETPRDRVATPSEFARLLQAIFEPTPAEREEGQGRDRRDALRDVLPFALAGYGGARRQEIEVLDWEHVNMEAGAGELAGDEEGRKPGGSWRVVPYVVPLWSLLREEWLAQGQPTSGKVCPPRRQSASGKLAAANLLRRVKARWEEQGLEPIDFHEARHTTATWLDHAGVSPKVSSEFIGHKTPEYRAGAARITQERYTHMLPGELERARRQLDEFLAERLREEPVVVPWRGL
jgi:integrase